MALFKSIERGRARRRIFWGRSSRPAMTVTGLGGNAIANGSAASLTNGTDFDDEEMGVTSTLTVTIANTLGTGALIVSGISVPSAAYTIQSISFPATINPGASTTFGLRFEGNFLAAGYGGNVVISSNDPTNPSWTFGVNADLWIIRATYAASRVAELGTLTYVEADGTIGWVSSFSGSILNTAQASSAWGDLAYRSAQITRPSGAAIVGTGTIRKVAAGGEHLWGFWPTTTLGANPRFALWGSTATILFLSNAGGATVIGSGISAGLDVPFSAIYMNGRYLIYLKLSGVWQFLCSFIASDAAMYWGWSNFSNTYNILETMVKPVDETVFAPSQLIASPVVGILPNAPLANVYIDCPSITLPSAGSIILAFRRQDANNYWQIEITSAGALEVDEVVAGTPTNRIAGTIATGNYLRLRANAAEIRLFRITTLTGTYASATNFQTELGLEIKSLGTGGALANLAIYPVQANAAQTTMLDLVLAG